MDETILVLSSGNFRGGGVTLPLDFLGVFLMKMSLAQWMQLMLVLPALVFFWWTILGHDEHYQKGMINTLYPPTIDPKNLDSTIAYFCGMMTGIFLWIFGAIFFVAINIYFWFYNSPKDTKDNNPQ